MYLELNTNQLKIKLKWRIKINLIKLMLLNRLNHITLSNTDL